MRTRSSLLTEVRQIPVFLVHCLYQSVPHQYFGYGPKAAVEPYRDPVRPAVDHHSYPVTLAIMGSWIGKYDFDLIFLQRPGEFQKYAILTQGSGLYLDRGTLTSEQPDTHAYKNPILI